MRRKSPASQKLHDDTQRVARQFVREDRSLPITTRLIREHLKLNGVLSNELKSIRVALDELVQLKELQRRPKKGARAFEYFAT